MDIREIQNLIKFVSKSGATEVKLEMDDFKITIKTTTRRSRAYNYLYTTRLLSYATSCSASTSSQLQQLQ